MRQAVAAVAGGVVAFALSGAAAQATVIAQYDFSVFDDADETTTTFTSPSIDGEANSAASVITSPSTDYTSNLHTETRVNPEFGDAFTHTSQAAGWSARSNNPAQDFGVYLPVDTYFSFSVVAQPGYQVSLASGSLSLLTGASSTIGGTTAKDYTLSYSTDGSSFTDVGTVLAGTNPGEAVLLSGSGTATAPISFSLAALTTPAPAFYFRLDPVAAAGSGQNGVLSQRAGFIDDLVLDGTVALVPEPGSLALAGLGGILLLLARRSR